MNFMMKKRLAAATLICAMAVSAIGCGSSNGSEDKIRSYDVEKYVTLGDYDGMEVEVAGDFHPRHCNSVKTYEYKILNREIPLPLKRFDTTFYYKKLDVDAMNRAAKYLVGAHDFKSFCAVGAQVFTTVRTIYEADFRKEGDYLIFRISGNGFLFNMVRIIVGTLLEIGRGNMEPEEINRILEALDRQKAGPTAPARGLLLVGYEFMEK